MNGKDSKEKLFIREDFVEWMAEVLAEAQRNGRITRQINFRETVQPLTGVELAERCPLTGSIKSVTMSFPPGCNNLVEVAFGHEQKKICPYSDYIALDSASPTYTSINEPVKMDEQLWCEILNHDNTYPHEISVLVILVGKYGDLSA
ncbi:hypothetical protein ES703_08685 [subsurface metagenome]